MQANSGNIILIGMPGSGKSTCGVVAAKLLLKNFFDTDLLIQIGRDGACNRSLTKKGWITLPGQRRRPFCPWILPVR